MEAYPESNAAHVAKMPGPTRNRPIEEMCNYLGQALSSLEKSVVSVGDAFSPAMRPNDMGLETPPESYPQASSSVACNLQEFCVRIANLERALNEYRARCEL